MPEAQEYVIDQVREIVKKAKRIPAEVAARVKGESRLSHSIENQKGPLKKIVGEYTDDNQVREANRMLNVIDYYEQALQDSPEDRQRKTREFEAVLKKRALFLWNTLPKYTEFDLSDPHNPRYEILPPKKYPSEKREDRMRRAKAVFATDFTEIKGDDAKWFELVKFIRTGEGEIERPFRAWQFYLEIQPREEKPHLRETIIQLNRLPVESGGSEDIVQVDLTTHARGLKHQTAVFEFKREENKIMIFPFTICWQPTVIGNKEITGWDRYSTRVGDWDSEQVLHEKDTLAFAIIQELLEATEVSWEEISSSSSLP